MFSTDSKYIGSRLKILSWYIKYIYNLKHLREHLINDFYDFKYRFNL